MQNSKPENKGFGDVVANITKAVGIEPCGGCKKRQEVLNKLIPFQNASDKEKEELKKVLTKTSLDSKDQEIILYAYCKAFNVKKFTPCTSCSGVWKSMIKKLNTLL